MRMQIGAVFGFRDGRIARQDLFSNWEVALEAAGLRSSRPNDVRRQPPGGFTGWLGVADWFIGRAGLQPSRRRATGVAAAGRLTPAPATRSPDRGPAATAVLAALAPGTADSGRTAPPAPLHSVRCRRSRSPDRLHPCQPTPVVGIAVDGEGGPRTLAKPPHPRELGARHSLRLVVDRAPQLPSTTANVTGSTRG